MAVEDSATRETVSSARLSRDISKLTSRPNAIRYQAQAAFAAAATNIDLYIFGNEESPAVCEVKGRKSGAGFVTLEKWLGEYDALFLRRNNADPLVVLPWRIWARLIDKVKP